MATISDVQVLRPFPVFEVTLFRIEIRGRTFDVLIEADEAADAEDVHVEECAAG